MNPQLADSKGSGPPVNMPETLQPTYVGFVRTAKDACLLLEMLLSGKLPHVQRRPHERERAEIVKSGNVFIYEESISGVRRWTDGVNWSPSRILGNFLIYREVKQGYPGEGGKKTAIKKKPKPSPVTNGGVKKRSPETNGIYNHAAALAASQGSNDPNRLELRDLYGSLVESYPFVEGGLVKKTITVIVEGIPHHLVSYYKAQDVLDGKLITPSNDPLFVNVTPRESLLRNQTFRLPVEHEELKINENSEAFVTQERARLHHLYQPQPIFPPPIPMVPNDMQHHGLPASSLSPHGMPEHHGLPSVGMGMTYGPPPAFPYQNYRQMPPQAQTTLAGSMQGLAQNGLDALNNGTYQQHSQHGFVQDPQQSYVTGMGGLGGMASMPNMQNNFTPDPSRHMSFASPQSNGYTSPHPQPQVFPGQQSFRQPSIAAAQNGYGGYVPHAPQPDPSLGRDMQQHGGALDESQNNPDPNWPVSVYHQNNNTSGLQSESSSNSSSMYTPDTTIFTPDGTPNLSPTSSSLATTRRTKPCDTLTISTLNEARAAMFSYASTPYDIRGVGAMHDSLKPPYAHNQFPKLGTSSIDPGRTETIDGLGEELEQMAAAYGGSASATDLSGNDPGAVKNRRMEPRLKALGAAGEVLPLADCQAAFDEEDLVRLLFPETNRRLIYKEDLDSIEDLDSMLDNSGSELGKAFTLNTSG